MAMAGQDSDLPTTLKVPSTASAMDVNQASRITGTNELPSQNSVHEYLTPAAILELGLDPENPVNNFDFDLGNLDWDGYFLLAVDGTALEALQESNDFGNENPEEKSLESAFDASAAQPESRSSSYSPNTHDESPMPEVQLSRGQESSTASQDDWSDLFGNLDSPGHEINDSSPANFELSDNASGLAFLQSLQLPVGGETQPAMSLDVGYNLQRLPHATGPSRSQGYESRRLASDGSSSEMRTVSARSSEPNLGNGSRAVLTNAHRYSKRYGRGATQGRINKDYIENRAYTPLRQAPETWGIFEYTKDGELDPSRLFSPEEIRRYLFDHPLHQGHPNLKESQLKLRIHKTPASSAKRFPNGLRCRFKDCPMRTINQGQLLVVADGKALF